MTDAERDRLLADALEYAGGTHTVADVLEAIASGAYQEWRGDRSVVVTQVVENPRVKEAHAFLCAGSLDEVKTMYPVILDWARSIGCTRATFTGRPGWGRTFLTRAEGWTSRLAQYEKEL